MSKYFYEDYDTPLHKYVYERPNGGTTVCYGNIKEDSNFAITCADEDYDGISADIDASELNSWHKVCDYLYNNYHKQVEEVVTC